ncbi:MAG: GDP-mannose 4,6-dehydratase [Candidatus Latescibacterota bacterium]|nr:GDP-mannose 4,6-dehydratase [Candidatus Latescibacterota bacterium]
MSRTVLVTGGSGFIGSNFVRYFLNRYPTDRIVNLDKLTYAGNPANLKDFDQNERYRFVHGDICDVEVVDALVAECDGIVNFAAESHVDRSIFGGAEFVQTDVYGTYVLLEAARKHDIGRFHQISTDEVYGSLAEGAWDEDFPLEPRNPYSASKASAEMLVRAYHITHGLETVVGERGIMLSGGQRQRVALARGLYPTADLLLLDDTLSAVDHGTEARLVDALVRGDAASRPTTFIVSHRISALRHADQILVLEEGQVVDRGTHADLLCRPGLYRDTWEIQEPSASVAP